MSLSSTFESDYFNWSKKKLFDRRSKITPVQFIFYWCQQFIILIKRLFVQNISYLWPKNLDYYCSKKIIRFLNKYFDTIVWCIYSKILVHKKLEMSGWNLAPIFHLQIWINICILKYYLLTLLHSLNNFYIGGNIRMCF